MTLYYIKRLKFWLLFSLLVRPNKFFKKYLLLNFMKLI